LGSAAEINTSFIENINMALFGRNRDEEFEDEDEFDEKEDRGDRKLTKKFRDLNPKNKKKRKEPPKPWGKKERMIVLIILLATVIISAILAFGARGSGTFRLGISKFDINSLNIFKEETIIVGKK
jgi:hypothetical protein